jgi:5-methylcytosine-specific restriction endonuclease McrA
MENLTIDHLVPRHLNGQHIWTNVVTACAQCNHRKGGRTLEEAHMHLLRIPREPPASVAYIFGRHLHDYVEWQPFLEGW